MKNGIVVLMILVMAASSWAEVPVGADAVGPASSGRTPNILFEKTVYDAGVTSLVQAISGSFSFRNAGRGELLLQKPASSCGCTVASVKPQGMRLSPGEHGEIDFTLTLGSSRGALSKQITVPTNDPQNSNVVLTVKVNVVDAFAVEPAQVMLGEVVLGTQTNAMVIVKRVDGKALRISKLESSEPMITMRQEPVEGTKESAVRLVLVAKPEGTPRAFYCRVTIYAEGVTNAIGTVGIFGRVVNELKLSPQELYISTGSQPVLPVEKRLQVESVRSDRVLELRNVQCEEPGLKTSLVTVKTGRVYEVVAKLETPPSSSRESVITFETNIPGQEKVQVPVTIKVLGR